MSAEPIESASATSKSKRNKKKKSKAAATAANGDPSRTNGVDPDHEGEDSEQLETNVNTGIESANEEEQLPSRNTESSNVAEDSAVHDHGDAPEASDPEARLEAAVRDRDRLRDEVVELRKSLEEIQKKHEDEVGSLSSKLEESESGKEHAESQYQKLLGKVNTLRTQLGERLKADAEELSLARGKIDDLQEENKSMTEDRDALRSQVEKLTTEKDQQAQEIHELRGRTNTSQQNWAKERDDLLSREARLREEFEAAKQVMQDWEVIAMEERSVKEGLGDRVAELEEQASNQTEAYESAAAERDSHSATIDGLQRALQDIQEARKQELREVVENSQAQVEDLRKQLKTAQDEATSSEAELKAAREELERALPFEKEVKEKNLLIGKLRHEVVTLGEHLTKALRFLKKGKPEDNVDRQLVTNHLLQFLALDRADPKKFQVLQIMSAVLGWTDEQKEQAGLARPGGSTQSSSSLRIPLAPFRRVSSTASLNTSLNPSQPLNTLFSPSAASPTGDVVSPGGKESIADLWSGFLEREAQEREANGSRRTSISTAGGNTPTMVRSPSSMHSASPQPGYNTRHKHASSRSVSFTQDH